MGIINSGQGTIEEMSNPRIGTALLRWRPISMRYDKEDSPYALPRGWNHGITMWEWQPWIEITCKEWSNDAKPPFSWFVTPRPVQYSYAEKALRFKDGLPTADPINAGTKLVLFVGPHVAVVTKKLKVADVMIKPEVQIIRLDSAAEVPEHGDTPDLGQMLGDRPVDEYFHNMPRNDNWRDRPKPKPGVFDQSPHMAVDIVRSGLELVMTKRFEYWQLKIKLSDVMPSFFRIKLLGISLRNHNGRNYAFHRLRVYHSPDTTVTFNVDLFAYNNKTLATASVETVCVPFDVPESKSQKRPLMGPIGNLPASPREDDAIMWDNYHDMEGIPKGGFKGQKAPVTLEPGLFENGRYQVLSLFTTTAIGFIPIVGQLYDVADCISIAMTGKDLWGAQRSETDIIMIAGLGILGGMGDLIGGIRSLPKDDLVAMTVVSEYLFPNATVISKNPNVATTFARAAFNSSNAALRRAAQTLSESGESSRLLKQLQQAAGERGMVNGTIAVITGSKTIDMAKFSDELVAALYTAMRKNADEIAFEDQPQILQIVLQEGRDLLKVADVNNGDPNTFKALSKIFDEADSAQNAAGVLAKIAKVDSGAAELMEELILQKVRQRLHTHPTIRRRYIAYCNKHDNPEGLEDFVNTTIETYLTKKATGQALDFFALIYGTATLKKLKGKGRKTPAELLASRSSYVNVVRKLMNDPNQYWKHRDDIRTLFAMYPGLGRILNSDHILEKRLRKMAIDDSMIDHSTFNALLVPADHQVAKVLKDNGVDLGWYIHVDKTRWMHELLPQGREGDLAIENVAAAYQYFWVHKMGASHETFKALVDHDLKNLAIEVFAGVMKREDAVKHVNSRMSGWFAPRPEKKLRLEIDLFRGRMGLERLSKTTIGNRLTTAPDL